MSIIYQSDAERKVGAPEGRAIARRLSPPPFSLLRQKCRVDGKGQRRAIPLL